jgi:hypothetical protein
MGNSGWVMPVLSISVMTTQEKLIALRENKIT